MDYLLIVFQKLCEKCECEPALLAKLRKIGQGNPQDHWVSVGTDYGVLRSSNGGESYFQMLKKIVTGGKHLIAADFFNQH